MTSCLFVSDLHGQINRYDKLFHCLLEEKPSVVFLGGDLLPGIWGMADADEVQGDFINNYLVKHLSDIRNRMADEYPEVFIILGNDDGKFEEQSIIDAADSGVWHYIHERRFAFGNFNIYGYACIPPSPIMLKDWERYDVSRHVDPGCIPPTEGYRSVPVERHKIEYETIAKDLEQLVGSDDLDRAVFLFHSPPYKTNLDRANLEGKMIDNVPLDVNIGSIAIQRFIKSYQPLITLHGHVHESARLTGSWQDRIGETWCFSAAHDGPELAVVRFDLDRPEKAERQLI